MISSTSPLSLSLALVGERLTARDPALSVRLAGCDDAAALRTLIQTEMAHSMAHAPAAAVDLMAGMSLDDWRSALARGWSAMLVMRGDQPVGAALLCWPASGPVTLKDALLVPELRRQGLAAAVLCGIVDAADAQSRPIQVLAPPKKRLGRLLTGCGFGKAAERGAQDMWVRPPSHHADAAAAAAE